MGQIKQTKLVFLIIEDDVFPLGVVYEFAKGLVLLTMI